MARIDKGALTRLEITSEASRQFLETGYSKTTIASIASALDMSKGNLTFYYKTKEYLLAELVDILCGFHWKQIEKEADDGISSIMAFCLDMTAMAAACEDDEIIRDFFVSAYTSPLCIKVIRKNGQERAKQVFESYRPDWKDEQFEEAALLVSGVEYATLIPTGETAGLETRISGALNIILDIYGIPEETRKLKIQKVFAKDYRRIGKQAITDFKNYVEKSNAQAFYDLLKMKYPI